MAGDMAWIIYDTATGNIVQPMQFTSVRKWTNLPQGCSALILPTDNPVVVKLGGYAMQKGLVKAGQLTTKP